MKQVMSSTAPSQGSVPAPVPLCCIKFLGTARAGPWRDPPHACVMEQHAEPCRRCLASGLPHGERSQGRSCGLLLRWGRVLQVHPLVHHRGAAPTSWGPFEALPTPGRLPHVPPAAQSPSPGPCSGAQYLRVYRPLIALKAMPRAVANPSSSRCSAKPSAGPAQTLWDAVVRSARCACPAVPHGTGLAPCCPTG